MVLFGNDTVTLFNRNIDPITEAEIWVPTVLSGVNLITNIGAGISTSGIKSGDAARLFLDDGSSEKRYVSQKEYEALPMDDRKNVFTFRPEVDFFVSEDISNVNILSSGFFEWVLKNYDDVFRVTSIDIYDNVMQHIEVGGK